MADENAVAPVATETTSQDTGTADQVEPKPTTPTEPPKRKLKVFGKEEEWDDDNILRFAQKGRAYEQQMQEIQKQQKLTQKQQRDFEELFKQNKRMALEKTIGRDALREAAIELIREEIEDQADPKSKETRQLKRELEDLKRQREEDERQKQESKLEADAERWRKAYDEEFTKALEGTKLRKHPSVMKRMAELQMKNLKGGHNIPLARIAKLVENEFQMDIKEYARSLDPESFEREFGDDFGEKYSQYRVSKLRSPTGQKPTQKTAPAPETKKDDGPLSLEEWEKRLAEKLK